MSQLIDTHTHIVSPDVERYPRKPGVAQSAWYDETPAAAEDLLREMDGAGVHGAVLVQAHGPYAGDNAYCADARSVAPDRFVSSSIIDVRAGDAVDQLRYWTLERGMAGTRVFHLPPPPRPWLADPELAPVYAEAQKLGVRVNFCVVRRHLPALGEVLATMPDTPVAVDHCGLIETPDAPPDDVFANLLALARFRELRLKVSTYVLDYAPQLGLSSPQLVRKLADEFGADRLMWGSDWPQTHHLAYAQLVEQGRNAAELLSPAERDSYLGGTAAAFYPELARR